MIRTAALLAMLAASPVAAGPPNSLALTEERGQRTAPDFVLVRAELGSASCALSGEVHFTLSVEGSAPLRVNVPDPPLGTASATLWKSRAVGPPLVTELPDGRQRWQKSFRLFPYAHGDSVPVLPAAITVRAATASTDTLIQWSQPLAVRVTTSITQPDVADLRPPADIEPVSAGDDGSTESWRSTAAFALVAILAVGGTLYVRYRLRRRVPPPDGRQRALRDLALLEARGVADVRAFQELADITRRYAEYRFEVAATRLTTQELLVHLGQNNEVARDSLQAIHTVLEIGDLAKFAAPVSSADSLERDLARVVGSARRLFEEAGSQGREGTV